MVPEAYREFLAGSAQASAALIGLLFVAVSLDPERVLGPGAPLLRRARALSAFTALADAFFTSLAGLIPRVSVGQVAVVSAIIALSQTLGLLLLFPDWWNQPGFRRGAFLFLLSATVYIAQLVSGWRVAVSAKDLGALSMLFYSILAMYFIGLSRAWELMGASERRGLISLLAGRLGGRQTGVPRVSRTDEVGGPGQGPSDPTSEEGSSSIPRG